MKKLFFVRHGESEANAAKVWSPYDSPLTGLGRWQASAAGCDARQRGLTFDCIISSPQPRAHETAKLIAEEIEYGEPVQTWPLLAERDWGQLAGEAERKYFERGGTLEGLNNMATVEHIENLQQRAAETLAKLQQLPEDAVLIVGHGDFGRALKRAVKREHWSQEYTAQLEEQSLPQARIMQII